MASIKFTKAIEEKRFFSCFTVIMTLKHEKKIHFNNEVITQQCWPNGYNIFQQCVIISLLTIFAVMICYLSINERKA